MISIDSELENMSVASQGADSKSDSQSDDDSTPTQRLRDPVLRPPSHASDEDSYTSALEEIDEMDQDPDYPSYFSFTSEELQTIRQCIRNVDLPTYVHRPPGNLGNASHGKLKASDYHTLFTVIFPIILPELWYPTERQEEKLLLENLYSLVASTNIVSSFSVSPRDADDYMRNYIQYRRSAEQLFENFSSRPNHHFAMHNGELLKYWGPLAMLSEFPGERMNGVMQNINTNRHICKFICVYLFINSD